MKRRVSRLQWVEVCKKGGGVFKKTKKKKRRKAKFVENLITQPFLLPLFLSL